MPGDRRFLYALVVSGVYYLIKEVLIFTRIGLTQKGGSNFFEKATIKLRYNNAYLLGVIPL